MPANGSGKGGIATPAAGFTLIEVLVALAIIAIALIAALKASAALIDTNSGLHRRLLATWSADNDLANLHLTRAWPDLGTRNFECDQGDVALACEEEVTATANPGFRRVVVRVHDAQQLDATLAELVGLLNNETARPL